MTDDNKKEYMFIEHHLLNLSDFLIFKHRENRYTIQFDFLYPEDYAHWTNMVEDVRVAIVNYAVFIYNNPKVSEDSTECKTYINEFYDKYKAVLSIFTNKRKGTKLRATENDWKIILPMVGKGVSTRGYRTKDEYLNKGKHIFRRDLENHITSRFINTYDIKA